MPYLFKDSDIAAQRLQVLANVFAPASRAFMHDCMGPTPQIAVDLGCGPGYTTHLLADCTRAVQTIGLDSSEHFITLASKNALANVLFMCHDVTQVPFPIPDGQSDFIFCRMLLTHLQDPQAIIAQWLTQLRPQGLLLMEEVEWIQVELLPFRTYLEIVAAMLEQQQNQLYIGPLLDKLHSEDQHGIKRHISRVYQLPVTTAQAATMFYLNILSWKNHPFIQQNYSTSTIEQLEHDLQALTEVPIHESSCTWGMRQIAYQHA